MARKKILNTLATAKFYPPTGRKEIWMYADPLTAFLPRIADPYRPNWHITLLRNSKLPPNMAEFMVPLRINKLDLKDYLFHAYGIAALAIRSSIQQHHLKRTWRGGGFYRPQATKRMVVQMEPSHRGGPFVWPAEETNFEPWDKQLFDDARSAQERQNENFGRYGTGQMPKQPAPLRAQVQALVERKQDWKPSWTQRGDLSGQHLGVGAPEELRDRVTPSDR